MRNVRTQSTFWRLTPRHKTLLHREYLIRVMLRTHKFPSLVWDSLTLRAFRGQLWTLNPPKGAPCHGNILLVITRVWREGLMWKLLLLACQSRRKGLNTAWFIVSKQTVNLWNEFSLAWRILRKSFYRHWEETFF